MTAGSSVVVEPSWEVEESAAALEMPNCAAVVSTGNCCEADRPLFGVREKCVNENAEPTPLPPAVGGATNRDPDAVVAAADVLSVSEVDGATCRVESPELFFVVEVEAPLPRRMGDAVGAAVFTRENIAPAKPDCKPLFVLHPWPDVSPMSPTEAERNAADGRLLRGIISGLEDDVTGGCSGLPKS